MPLDDIKLPSNAFLVFLLFSFRQVLAIGDGENDMEMLKAVKAAGGLAVAMGNAKDIVKAVAGVTTSSNDEDGFAQAVTAHVLSPPN